MEWTDEPRRGRASLRFGLLLLTGFLLFAPAVAKPVSAASAVPEPTVAPVIVDCLVFPDPRISVGSVCGDTSAPPGFVNVTVRFNVTVSDADGVDMNVTFYFDHRNLNGTINLDSPSVTVTVRAPGPGVSAYVETNWTYTRLSNFTNQNYWLLVEVRDANGELASRGDFPVYVTVNTEPFIDGLLSTYAASVDFPNPQVPLIYVNVTVGDVDDDPITVTWEWGDGSIDVSVEEPFTDLSVTHQYDPALFPLNETPRIFELSITVWVDDGIEGHNTSLPSSAEFDLEFDLPPRVTVDSPTVGSRYKVGDTVEMRGNASDPEEDPVETFWDFDVRVDSDGDGDPASDRDAIGSEASHAYDEPGDYSLAFWGSDGDTKKRCLDEDCSTWLSHWTKQEVTILVRANAPPFLAFGNHTALEDEPILLQIAVLDPEGDSLFVTWDFGDGTANATNATTAAPGASVPLYQEHVYTRASVCEHNPKLACPISLTVTVFDGNDTVVGVRSVFVEAFNLPPVIRGLAILRENRTVAANSTFLYDSIAVVRLNVTDEEGDPLNVTIDWGDGSVSMALVTLVGEGNATAVVTEGAVDECKLNETGHIVCYFSHRYGDIGDSELRGYLIAVTIRDGELYAFFDENGTIISLSHVIRDFASLQVVHPRAHGLGPWDAWDLGTLAVAFGLPIGLLTRAAWRIRRERAEE